MKSAMVRFIPAVLWMAVIFWLSSRTGSELGALFPYVERWFPWLDGFNFGHFIAYFILALLLWFGLGCSNKLSVKVLAVAWSALYGVSDEVHQMFVEGRTADIVDLRNDVIGAALAMIAVSLPPVRRLLQKLRIV